MISTYTLGEYSAEDTVTDITYTNATDMFMSEL